jgi:hypothetical protein
MGIKKTEEIIDMLGDCMLRYKKMTEWERDFVNNIYELNEISEKQKDVLDKIWDRVTSNN